MSACPIQSLIATVEDPAQHRGEHVGGRLGLTQKMLVDPRVQSELREAGEPVERLRLKARPRVQHGARDRLLERLALRRLRELVRRVLDVPRSERDARYERGGRVDLDRRPHEQACLLPCRRDLVARDAARVQLAGAEADVLRAPPGGQRTRRPGPTATRRSAAELGRSTCHDRVVQAPPNAARANRPATE